jgi:ribosome biogenesis GTPase
MSFQTFSLHQLGWRPEYAQQLTLADFEAGFPARVMAVHRSGLLVLSSRGHGSVALPHHVTDAGVAVGDWVLVEHEADRVMRVLDRQSLVERVASGGDHRRQSIAANLDVLFVVSSCNDDFNPSRLERYLTLALDAGVTPVIVLTKADIGEGVAGYVTAAEQLMPGVPVIAVNALDEGSVSQLEPWLIPGKTVAFVGSSGVGKSTLTNGVIGEASQRTFGIREDDAHGRHTTTSREMFPTSSGAWVIDTPGMRELRLAAAEPGTSRGSPCSAAFAIAITMVMRVARWKRQWPTARWMRGVSPTIANCSGKPCAHSKRCASSANKAASSVRWQSR